MLSSRKITIYAIVLILQLLFMSVKSAKVLCCKYIKDSRENPQNITGGLFYQLRWLALFCAGNTNIHKYQEELQWLSSNNLNSAKIMHLFSYHKQCEPSWVGLVWRCGSARSQWDRRRKSLLWRHSEETGGARGEAAASKNGFRPGTGKRAIQF